MLIQTHNFAFTACQIVFMAEMMNKLHYRMVNQLDIAEIEKHLFVLRKFSQLTFQRDEVTENGRAGYLDVKNIRAHSYWAK